MKTIFKSKKEKEINLKFGIILFLFVSIIATAGVIIGTFPIKLYLLLLLMMAILVTLFILIKVFYIEGIDDL